jgi:phospholipid transport system substrate-binding protein
MISSSRCSRRTALLAALATLAILAAPRPSQASPALDAIETLNGTLLSVMQNAAKLGYDGRYRELEPVVQRTFDHPFMAQVMTGRFWAGFTAAQRDLLVTTLRRFTAATYAARFDGYSGQMFEILGEAPGPRDMVLVKTKIVSSPSDAVAIDYLMRPEGSKAAIADVFFNQSVSEVALRRSEYTAVLSRDGFDGLVTSIQGKIADLEAAGRAKK